MVGELGIEPSMGFPGGVTVRCRTLQHLARAESQISPLAPDVNRFSRMGEIIFTARPRAAHGAWSAARGPVPKPPARRGASMHKPRKTKKPEWAGKKARREKAGDSVWLFGLHAVSAALENPRREKLTLVVTKNAHDRIEPSIRRAGMEPRISDSRKFSAPLDPQSVHQGAALEARPLSWGSLSGACQPGGSGAPLLLLDRITDPHNVGAILRSAEALGARAVIAPERHSAPESGALAKSASGALERIPYIRVRNLAAAMAELKDMGYRLVGLDERGQESLESQLGSSVEPAAIALGAEGAGLRQLTRETCDTLARIETVGSLSSLNVSNAAAIALYAASRERRGKSLESGGGPRDE